MNRKKFVVKKLNKQLKNNTIELYRTQTQTQTQRTILATACVLGSTYRVFLHFILLILVCFLMDYFFGPIIVCLCVCVNSEC